MRTAALHCAMSILWSGLVTLAIVLVDILVQCWHVACGVRPCVIFWSGAIIHLFHRLQIFFFFRRDLCLEVVKWRRPGTVCNFSIVWSSKKFFTCRKLEPRVCSCYMRFDPCKFHHRTKDAIVAEPKFMDIVFGRSSWKIWRITSPVYGGCSRMQSTELRQSCFLMLPNS